MMGGKLSVSFAVLGLAIATMAGSAAAQQAVDPQVDQTRAAELEAEAEVLMANRNDWKRAERLLREAASLRPAGDVLAVEDLLAAAKLVYYEGKERRAIRELEHVGQRALEEGFKDAFDRLLHSRDANGFNAVDWCRNVKPGVVRAGSATTRPALSKLGVEPLA